jgi:hypothetical protein
MNHARVFELVAFHSELNPARPAIGLRCLRLCRWQGL